MRATDVIVDFSDATDNVIIQQSEKKIKWIAIRGFEELDEKKRRKKNK